MEKILWALVIFALIGLGIGGAVWAVQSGIFRVGEAIGAPTYQQAAPAAGPTKVPLKPKDGCMGC